MKRPNDKIDRMMIDWMMRERAVPLVTLLILALPGLATLGCGSPKAADSESADVETAAFDAGEPKVRDALLDGRRVRYLDVGRDEPTLVLVHGWASDRQAFRFQVETLRESFRLLAIDLPGHGESEEPAAPYSMDLLARGVESVMDDAGVERAVLVAHSNGTPVIRQFYRLFPERTLALVVVDGPLLQAFDESTAKQMLAGFEGADYAATLAGVLDSMPTFGLSEELHAEIRAMALRQPQHAIVGGLQAALDTAIWTRDPIEVPLLLVLARQPAWDEQYISTVKGLAPQVEIRWFEEVSHFLMMERPAEFDAILADFVQQSGL